MESRSFSDWKLSKRQGNFGEDATREERDWDIGRIRYFRRLIREGVSLAPICVENSTYNARFIIDVEIMDGHHRLCAAILERKRKIRADYGGRVDIMNYLRGKRKRLPQD